MTKSSELASLIAALLALALLHGVLGYLAALAIAAPALRRLRWLDFKPPYLAAALAAYAAAFAVDYLTAPPQRSVDVITALALAPIVEEVIFRGLVFEVFPARIAAPLSALSFAVLHPHPLVALMYAVALTLAYLGGGLAASIAMHAANNLTWALIYL